MAVCSACLLHSLSLLDRWPKNKGFTKKKNKIKTTPQCSRWSPPVPAMGWSPTPSQLQSLTRSGCWCSSIILQKLLICYLFKSSTWDTFWLSHLSVWLKRNIEYFTPSNDFISHHWKLIWIIYFRLNSYETWKYKEMCGVKDSIKDGKSIYDINFPGNFSSDAEFFVFTGVFAWLYCFVRFEIIFSLAELLNVPFLVWLCMCSSTTYM